jgi:hypothetical protein
MDGVEPRYKPLAVCGGGLCLCSGLKDKPAILDEKLVYAAMLFYDMDHALCAKAMFLFI